ncbi:hypothetical protein D1007_00447 [Hordeum vulgare]|nr:hypothetical protein D1007_00447 [Hordeum vulgare]
MEEHAPLVLWLQPYGCCNGPTWVSKEFNSLGLMFSGHGWKSFALSQGLEERHVLRFKFDEASTLFMKAFGSASGRAGCCMEGYSSGGSIPSDPDGSGSSSSEGSGGDSDSDGSRSPMSRRRKAPTNHARCHH